MGRRLVLSAIWNLTDAQLQGGLEKSQMTKADLVAKMEAFTRKTVCSQETSAAFVGLGGQLQYNYGTRDGISVASVMVSTCP